MLSELSVVVVLSMWESSRRGGGRVAVRLESTSYWCTYHRYCGNAGTRVTGVRTSGIVKCWAQRYWWTYQRRCVNAGPKGFDARAGTSVGQPTRELVNRVTVFVSGNPAVFFNTAGTPEQVSKEFYMVSAWLVLRPVWLDFDCAVSEVVATFALFSFTPPPFLPSSSLFLCSLTAAHRFGRIFHFDIFGPIIRGRKDGPGFDVDCRDHGPLRGRAVALS